MTAGFRIRWEITQSLRLPERQFLARGPSCRCGLLIGGTLFASIYARLGSFPDGGYFSESRLACFPVVLKECLDQRQPDRVEVIGCKANVEPDYGREWVASVGGFDFGVGREGERLLDDLRSQGLIDRFDAFFPFGVFDSLGQDSACFVP